MYETIAMEPRPEREWREIGKFDYQEPSRKLSPSEKRKENVIVVLGFIGLGLLIYFFGAGSGTEYIAH